MTKIAIILGSTRPQRIGEQVASWVNGIATSRGDAEYELIDLRDHPLPHFDEPLSPFQGQYQNEHTLAWARTIDAFDGYVFVSPEYNGHTSGVLKNAIDYLHAEWMNKSVGLVTYGIAGGAGAAGQLRKVCGQLGMADVSKHVLLSVHTDFENFTVFRPNGYAEVTLAGLLDQVVAWSTALAPLRADAAP
jgi:NAD(P)H-dependent FMN reductase